MMASVFENDHDLESRVDQESPKPDFHKIFLSHYNDQELRDLWYFIKDSGFGHHLFLKGLFFEHGVFPAPEVDKKAAFDVYKLGADKKDSHCNFRLHFIYKKEYETFGVHKNRNLEMLHIIKAAAFFDEKDNRINRNIFDPVMHLAIHLDNEDQDLIKTVELLDKYKEESENAKKIGNFLHFWCCIRFSLSDHTKDECLKNLHTLAEEKDDEACYFLGELYRYGEELRQDLQLSRKYLETAKEGGCTKTIESLAYLYQITNQLDLSVQNYEEGAKLGSYTSLKIFGEYQIVGKYINQNFEQGMKNIYHAYLQCDFWAFLTTYEIYKFVELKERKNQSITSKMFHIAKNLFQIKTKVGKITHIRLAYSVYSECFEKGYGAKKDLNKAREILLESLDNIELEKTKTMIYYRLAIISERQGDYEEANKYYDSCIRACMMMVEEYNNRIKNTNYYYLLGKLLFLGRGTIKNIEKAIEYLREGAKMDNSFYFGALYSKKCQNLLRKIPIQKNLCKITEIKIKERTNLPKISRETSLFEISALLFDVYINTVGPVKTFYGKLKGQPVKLEEYFYISQKNYTFLINHLVRMMNTKCSFLEKMIGVAIDPKTCLVVSVFKPLDIKFVSLEEYFEVEKFTEKTMSNLKSDQRLTCQRSQYTEENHPSERICLKIPFQQKVDICLKIANAIHSLHTLNIPHGNLSPKSVYISPSYDIVVGKYGYENPNFYDTDATFHKEENLLGDTAKYLAPERFQGYKVVTPSSDIWSLGSLIYLIFCEKPLLNNINVGDIVQAHKKKITFDWKFPEEISKEIQSLIQHCIQINPKDRCEISYIIKNLQK